MTAIAAVTESLRKIEEVGWKDALNCIVAADPDASLREAEERDSRRAPGTLAGVPYAVKDNFATLGLPTTCGSKILEGYVSPYEATAVAKLNAAGGVLVAKTNCDEFAMGSSNEYSAYGAVKNPVAPTRVPGGSSGGSAAAVAAGIVRIALGSETGGSVRQPAAYCGVVGVKPTYGRVSRFGLVAFASSLDHVAVFGRTVRDSALALEAIAGHDPLDSTSERVTMPSLSPRRTQIRDLKGVKIGRPVEYFPPMLDPRIRLLCERAIENLRARGATVDDVHLENTEFAIPVYYILAPAEASSNLARFDGVRYPDRKKGDGLRGMYETTRTLGFGAEVTRRILLGTYVLSAGYYDAYYRRAQEALARIREDFRVVFNKGYDALFTPTTPSPAFRFGAKSDPYEMYLNDIFTATANLAGVPAMSLPIGRVTEPPLHADESPNLRLPVGGQIIAPKFHEEMMFRIAFALEDALGEEAHR